MLALAGDAEAIISSAGTWSAFGTSAATAAADVRRIDSTDFVGDEADTYRERLNRDLPPHLDAVSGAWSTVAGALQTYAGVLQAVQSRMSGLSATAGEQLAEMRVAADSLALAHAADDRHTAALSSSGTAPAPDVYQSQTATASEQLSDAHAAVQATTDAANRLHAEHSAAVNACVGMINRAAGMRFEEPPGFWGRLENSVVGWVGAHADVLRSVSAVLKQVSSIAGLLAMIPVLAPVMGPLALMSAAGGVLIDGSLKLATGEGSWSDVLIDGASLVPFAKGLAVVREARAGTAAVKGAETLDKVAADVTGGRRAAAAGGTGHSMPADMDVSPAGGARAVDSPGAAVNVRTPVEKRTCVSDPVDVVSGEVVMAQTDLVLPGVLPLVLRRVHVSSYRWGGHFGASWASTLDQRVEVGAAGGVCFVAEDGVVLHYPAAALGAVSLPTVGAQRWPLSRLDDGGWTVEDPDSGVIRRFAAPDADGRSMLVQISDRNLNAIAFEYDAGGNVCRVRHSGGYQVDVETRDGLVTALSVSHGASPLLIRSFRYEAGNLVQIANSDGPPLHLEYDRDGRILGWTDRNGIWYRYIYDEAGRCVRTSGRGRVLSYGFSYLPGRTMVTDSLGAVSTYEHNDLRQVIRHIDPLGNVTSSVLDQFDRLLLGTDSLGRTTSFEYDEAGRLSSTTRPDGSRERWQYNEYGLPTAAVDADGAEWRSTYDSRGNLLSVTDPLGAVMRCTRGLSGAVETMTDALGGVTSVLTNAAGLPVEITDPAGARTNQAYDDFGRLIRTVGPDGGITTFGWTREGKPAWRIAPDGARDQWQWDGEGNLTGHTGPTGAQTEIENGIFDLPVGRTTPDGGRLQFGYDTELRLTSVSNPAGLSWHYRYDAAGRLISETDFNGRTQAYEWDGAGQLVCIVNGLGDRIESAYDSMGKLVHRTSPDGWSRFGYDRAGRLLTARCPGSILEISRDLLGRVISETVNGRQVSSEFDAAGYRISRTTPSGVESRWGFAPTGRPSSLITGGHAIAFAYDAAGRETDRMFSAGGHLRQTFDSAGRLAGQDVGPISRSFGYRLGGGLHWVGDPADGIGRTLDLDSSSRVVGVTAADWTESYAYDIAGGVAAASTGPDHRGSDAGAGEHDYSGTLINRAGAIRYEHDGQGRMVRRSCRRLSRQPEVWDFGYDSADRLVSACSDDKRWTYDYDPLGRRIGKQRVDQDGVVVEHFEFSWDGDRLIEQTRTIGDQPAVTTSWEYLPDSWAPISQLVGTSAIDQEFFAIVSDQVGQPTELLTPDGARVAWRNADRTIWGAPRTARAGNGSTKYEVDCPIRFPGQYADDETGLHYNRHRYYDPECARYTTSDPLGLAPAPDPYAYVPNPTIWSDPLGLAPCDPAELEWDEANGGHTIERHVGKSVKYLKGRDIA